MPPKTLVKVGMCAVLLALVVFWMTSHWLETRKFEPVNKLIVLEAGKTQTVGFEINLREDYYVGLSADYSLDDSTEGKCNSKALADADWRVYRLKTEAAANKELWASSEEMRREGQVPIGFRGLRGKYQLEWSIPDAAVCLNARHPILRVWADTSDYETAFSFVLIACVLFAVAGAGALLRALILWLTAIPQRKHSLRMIPEMPLQNVIRLRHHLPMALFKEIPNFGLLCGFILWVLMFDFMIFGPRPSSGLLLDFQRERTVIVEKNPWADTMAVYVDAKRGFLINGKRVAREELRSKLEEELLRRGVWVVYFEADGNCLYMDAIYAMDTIQGLGAKMIWITPKTREEWKKRVFTNANATSRVQ